VRAGQISPLAARLAVLAVALVALGGASLLTTALAAAATKSSAALPPPLPHGGPVPPRGVRRAPLARAPVARAPAGRMPLPLHGIGAVKPAALARQPGAAHAGVLGGPATSAARRAGVLQGTGLRRRPTQP